MRPPKLRSRAVILSIAAIGLCGAVAGALAAGSGNRPVAYDAAGGNFTGVRPTAVGLPQIGESGTVGAGEFAASLRSYHDSGAYERDLTAVGGAAKAYLDSRLAKRSSADCTFKIAPTLALYKDARSHRVAVFFVTGRPSAIQSQTEGNLHAAGYDGWTGISFKPGGGTEAFKSSERAKIERQGYDIVVNMGDQESDLDGGHADRAFKLPNPFYYVAD